LYKNLSDFPPVLTVPEAASILRIGRNRAYRLVREKKIPAFYLGRSPRIPRDVLIEYITKQSGTKGMQLRCVK